MRARILTIGFAILLLLPLIDQVLGLSRSIKSTENRQLQPPPTLHFPHVRSFVSDFDRYYKENFGWRNALFYVFSNWKYYVLDQSPLPEKVVAGKNGWFYLGNSENRVIDQHRGLLPFSVDTLEAITRHLTQHQLALAQRGIKLFVLIAPDSHSIYPENLPDQLRPQTKESRLDQFMDYARRHSSVPIIDIRDTLLATKRQFTLYHQTDTHWNNMGTLIGCAALLKKMAQTEPSLELPSWRNYTIREERGAGGDLVSLFMLQQKIRDSVHYEIEPIARLKSHPTDTIPNHQGGFPAIRFCGPDSRKSRLLFIGDSFSYSMMQYLPSYFSRAYFVRDHHIDPALVNAEQPDVIVVEIVERNLNWLKAL